MEFVLSIIWIICIEYYDVYIAYSVPLVCSSCVKTCSTRWTTMQMRTQRFLSRCVAVCV